MMRLLSRLRKAADKQRRPRQRQAKIAGADRPGPEAAGRQYPAYDYLRRRRRPRRPQDLRRLSGDQRLPRRPGRRHHGRRRRLPDLPDIRLRAGRLLVHHGRHRHPPDHLHCRICRHQPVRHLWLHLLHPGHGHAAGLPDRHPGRLAGDQGRHRHHHPRLLRHRHLAGFINRVFALPPKLAKMGYICHDQGNRQDAGNCGHLIFFVVLGSFAIWVFYIFFHQHPHPQGGGAKAALRPRR